MRERDLVFIWLQGKDINWSLLIFVLVTDQTPVMRGTIFVRCTTAHAHCAYARKRYCHYLIASHGSQLIIAIIFLSHRLNNCNARDYSSQITVRPCALCARAEGSCRYLIAKERYQPIIVDLCLSHRSNTCNAQDYSCQISNRACALWICAEEISSLSGCKA